MTQQCLKYVVWAICIAFYILLICQWPKNFEACGVYNCTYVPTDIPGCYQIHVNTTLNRTCEICEPRTNGTQCYVRPHEVCPRHLDCVNPIKVTIEVCLVFGGGLFLLFFLLWIISTEKTPSLQEAPTAGEFQHLIVQMKPVPSYRATENVDV
jgi:hypothetical protein